jgi:hypothetical protein
MAWATLFVSQVINLVIHVKFLSATALGPWSLQRYSDFGREVLGYLQVMTDLPIRFALPFALWVGFNWHEIGQLIGSETGDD